MKYISQIEELKQKLNSISSTAMMNEPEGDVSILYAKPQYSTIKSPISLNNERILLTHNNSLNHPISSSQSFVTARTNRSNVTNKTDISKYNQIQQRINALKNNNNSSMNYSKYNDTYSHQKGDECLVLVAKVLSNISNTYQDVGFYRYGGEEFIGIIKNRDNLKSIYAIAEEIRGNIEALNIEHKESIHNIVTVSIGFTYIIDEENFDYKEALNQADIALYKAKDNGRNRVERFICE